MGRSVSYPHDSIVCFRTLNIGAGNGDDEELDYFDFDELIDDYRYLIRDLFPSMQDWDSWIGREDHAITRNGFCYFGVSEYCGLVSIWLAKRADLDGSVDAMADRWMAQVAPRFRKAFGALRHIGTASNGEAFFERIEA